MNQIAQEFSLQIDVCANGYIVRQPYNARTDACSSVREFQVFETFDALTDYLRSRLPIYPVFTGTTLTTTLRQPARKR